MTADQHRTIGRMLGIPDCCIEAFLTRRAVSPYPGVLRGPCRTPEEVREADAAGSAILGEPWFGGALDPRRCHVPCDACAVAVFAGNHPAGWVFEDDHDLICDEDHTHVEQAVVAWLEHLEEKELSA